MTRRHHALEGPRLRGRGPQGAVRRAARALQPPPAHPRGRARGPAEAAGGQGAAAGRRRAGLADRALPGRGRRGNAGHRRQRRRRPLQPPAPGHPHHRPHRRPQGRLRRGADPRASTPTSRSSSTRRASTPPTSWRSSRATTSSSTASTTSRPATCSTTRPCGWRSRWSRPPSWASRASSRSSSPTTGPCYRCLYPAPPPAELAPSCGANGVLGVLPGTMGLLQATEVIKLVIGEGDPLVGRLLLYDALAASFTELKVRRDPDCPICSRDPERDLRRGDGRLPRLRGVLRRRWLGSRARDMATVKIPPVLRPSVGGEKELSASGALGRRGPALR